MRVALAALESRAGEAEQNLRRLRDVMREHAEWGVDLVVVGEAFAQGFASITDDPERDLALGWDLDGPELAPVRRWARTFGIAVCLPYLERSVLGLHSSAVVIDRAGRTLANYRRMSVGWRDPRAASPVYVEGVAPVEFALAGKRCTVALCGDVWELPERFAAVKPDVLLWPVWTDYTAEHWEGGEQQAYAEQANRVYAAALLVNCVGDGVKGGASWFRNGKIKASLPMGSPGVLVCDL